MICARMAQHDLGDVGVSRFAGLVPWLDNTCTLTFEYENFANYRSAVTAPKTRKGRASPGHSPARRAARTPSPAVQ
jgi:hypothetical protein